jgi:hypothetical protein
MEMFTTFQRAKRTSWADLIIICVCRIVPSFIKVNFRPLVLVLMLRAPSLLAASKPIVHMISGD